jgi:hypothetical protein
LSTRRPETFPQPTTAGASSTVGTLMAHSRVATRFSKVKLLSLTTQPTSGGSKSIMVCQDMGITFGRPRRAVVRSTTGPVSSSR